MAILFLAMLWLLSSVAEAQTYQPDMDDLLKDFNRIPIADPYCTPDEGVYENLNPAIIDTSEFVTNEHLCTDVSVSEIPTEVVDWVLVELRAVARADSNSDPVPATAVGSTVIARKPAFLLTNGRIVDAEEYAGLDAANQTPAPCTGLTENLNCPDLLFDEGDVATEVQGKDLYLVIRHRNHLDIMSSTPLTDSSGVYPYDFTRSVSNTYLNSIGSNAKNLGKIAMHSGDTNLSNSITSADYIDEIRTYLPTTPGYLRGDANFSGSITSADYIDSVRAKLPVTQGRVPD